MWAAILAPLLVLMFGSYSFADLVDGGEVPILLIDLAVTAGGALTLYGTVAYVIGRRRAPLRPEVASLSNARGRTGTARHRS